MSRLNRPEEVLFLLFAIAHALLTGVAAFVALQAWLGTGWAIPLGIASFLLVRGAAWPVLAIFGATQGWAWPWWVSIPLFLPGLFLLPLLAPLAARVSKQSSSRD